MKIAIVGDGRMGRAVAGVAADRGIEVVATIGHAANPGGGALTAANLRGADVVVEFTVPAAVRQNLQALRSIGARVVSGTTGWDPSQSERDADWKAAGGALLVGSNFSLGLHLMLRAARALAEGVRDRSEFDGFVVEEHHRAKLDAPSGTALSLQRALAAADPSRAWPITSVRAGWMPGEHEVRLDAPFESVSVRHSVRDRRVFAAGALTAAEWLQGRQGLFTIDDLFEGA